MIETTYPFITLEQVKAENLMNVRDTISTYDIILKRLIKTVCASIQQYIRRPLHYQEFIEYFDTNFNAQTSLDLYGNDSTGLVSHYKERFFMLKGYPIDTDEDFKVYYDTSRLFPDTSLIENDSTIENYYIDTEKSILKTYFSMYNGNRSLKVVYSAGYEIDTFDPDFYYLEGVPESLQEAALMGVAYMFKKKQESNIGMKQDRTIKAESEVEFARKDYLPMEVIQLIEPFKLRRL